MEFEIQFTDRTLLETNGEFSKVCKIMEQDALETGASSVSKEWMVRSNITIMSHFGFALLVCHFYQNGKVYISEYRPSTKDIHNTDIRCLTFWCNQLGWNTPEPLPPLVDSWLLFWKKEWETYIVNSEYLDKKFGKREDRQFDDVKRDSDDDGDDYQPIKIGDEDS